MKNIRIKRTMTAVIRQEIKLLVPDSYVFDADDDFSADIVDIEEETLDVVDAEAFVQMTDQKEHQMVHLETDHPEYGKVPLCGRADWSRLTRRNELNECWECASIESHNWPVRHEGGNDD